MARACWLLAVLWIGLVAFGSGVVAYGQGAAGTAAPAKAAEPLRTTCTVDSNPPSPAETALNQGDFVTAEKLFRELLAKSADDASAHEGLVRTLIGQDRVEAAAKDAEAWVVAEPGRPMAMVALGDARLRAGNPREALHQFQLAVKADLCNARAYYGVAEIDRLAGYHATAKRLIEQAYVLHPTDDDIHTTWISTRPRKERLALWGEYAADSKEINDDDRAKLKTRLDKESLYHVSDCRMAATSPRQATVPMVAVTDWSGFLGFGLEVQFNGKRRELQIDTGASGITISRAAALFLGIRREDTTQVGGFGGKKEVKSSIAHIASVKIGGIEFTNCPVEILEKWGVLDSDGLIGGDVFAASQLTLDFPKHELRIAPLPLRPGETEADRAKWEEAGDDAVFEPHDPYIAPEMAKWQLIYRSGHDLLMPTGIVDTTQMNDDSAWKEKLFLLDTGSFSNLISPAAAREVTNVSRDNKSGVQGIQGEVDEVFAAGKFTLAFAGLRLNSPRMTSIDTTKISHDDGVEVSGLIGAPALFQVVMHIDYRDNLVLFEHRPKK